MSNSFHFKPADRNTFACPMGNELYEDHQKNHFPDFSVTSFRLRVHYFRSVHVCLHEMEERRARLLLSCTSFSFRSLEIDTSIFEACHRLLV